MQQRVTPKTLIAENKRRDYGRVRNDLKVILSHRSIQESVVKITRSYSFHSIYHRVRTRITP